MTYKGYTISKTHEGYSVKPPTGPAWNEYAVTLAMAMRWVECHIHESRQPVVKIVIPVNGEIVTGNP